MEKVVKEAYKIATKALEKCIGKHGLYAAINRFKDYWARDAFFASFGAIYLKNFEIVKKQLLFFIAHQKKSGHIPRLIPKNTFFRIIFMNLERIFDNPFFSPFLSYFSRDQNSLFVISAWEYIKKTKDYDFARKHFDNFERAVKWNFKYDIDKDLLIEEGAFADWKDTIRKKPESLFLNLCNYKSILCLAEIASMIKLPEKKRKYTTLAEVIKKRINQEFWTGSFYTDSLEIEGTAKKQKTPIFEGGSNMLAIYWKVADKKRSKAIFEYIKEHNLENFSIEVSYPNYPDTEVLFIFKLMRMKEYHNDMVWLWIGCVGALAYVVAGYKKKAKHLLRKISRKIVEYNEVYEVYETSGEPVKRFFYKSAHPFAWGAGLFVYAVNKIEKN